MQILVPMCTYPRHIFACAWYFFDATRDREPWHFGNINSDIMKFLFGMLPDAPDVIWMRDERTLMCSTIQPFAPWKLELSGQPTLYIVGNNKVLCRYEQHIKLWDFSACPHREIWSARYPPCWSLESADWDEMTERLLICCNTDHIQVYKDGRCPDILALAKQEETNMVISPNGKLLMSFTDSSIQIWDMSIGCIVASFQRLLEGGEILSTEFSPDSTMLLVSYSQGQVCIYNVVNRSAIEVVYETDTYGVLVQWAPDSRAISIIIRQNNFLVESNLYVYDIDRDVLRCITRFLRSWRVMQCSVAWSPALPRRIAMRRIVDLKVIALTIIDDNGDLILDVAQDCVENMFSRAFETRLCWNTQGDKIASVSTVNKNGRLQSDILIVDLHDLRNPKRYIAPARLGNYLSTIVSWSSDGNAFAGVFHDEGGAFIWAVEPGGWMRFSKHYQAIPGFCWHPGTKRITWFIRERHFITSYGQMSVLQDPDEIRCDLQGNQC